VLLFNRAKQPSAPFSLKYLPSELSTSTLLGEQPTNSNKRVRLEKNLM
jgi:hypothetical protein